MTRAPLRISLAGGGSDLPSFYVQDFGEVLSFSINKYVYIAAHSYFSGGIRLSYSQTETVTNFQSIRHPLFKNVLKYFNFDGNIELSSFADIPGTGTGLGSSSAFTVALVRSLSQYMKLEHSTEEIARIACEVEIEMCGDPIGKQDQYASAFGGIKRYRFNADHSVSVIDKGDFTTKTDFLNNSLLLFYTGYGRSSTTILENQSSSMISSKQSYRAVARIRDKVRGMEDAIAAEDVYRVGDLIDSAWQEKKSLDAGISNSEIDELLLYARKFGSLGGKLVGAGGGGFLLVCVPSERRAEFLKNFTLLPNFPFRISHTGVEVIYSEGEESGWIAQT